MTRIRNFIRQSIIGGLLVISPSIIIFFAFRWAFTTVNSAISPIATPISAYTSAPVLVVDIMVILLILMACFLVGTLASTGTGKWLHTHFDESLSKLAPGYNLIRDIVHQILSNKSDSPFTKGEVARARLFGADIPTEVTAIVTSRHHDGWFTLFVPTGPNPTSGMIYHLPPNQVTLTPNIKVEEALRTIIACGAGTAALFERHHYANKT